MLNASHESLHYQAQHCLRRAALSLLFLLVANATPANAQRERGELQIEVRDPQGQSAAAAAELLSESNQVKRILPFLLTENTWHQNWPSVSIA